VLAVGAILGEGPVWDEREQELLFVDIIGERVHRFRPATGEHAWFGTDGPTGAVVLTEEGQLLLALHDRFVYSGRSGENQVVVEGFQADGAVLRFNDGKVDPWGRFLVGTVDRKEARCRFASESCPVNLPGRVGGRLDLSACVRLLIGDPWAPSNVPPTEGGLRLRWAYAHQSRGHLRGCRPPAMWGPL
jgi:hypothetical protein